MLESNQEEPFSSRALTDASEHVGCFPLVAIGLTDWGVLPAPHSNSSEKLQGRAHSSGKRRSFVNTYLGNNDFKRGNLAHKCSEEIQVFI